MLLNHENPNVFVLGNEIVSSNFFYFKLFLVKVKSAIYNNNVMITNGLRVF